jgi:NADH:ubiquinone oxidoreductase subunit K
MWTVDFTYFFYFIFIFFAVNLLLLIAALDHFILALIFLDLLLLTNILLFILYTIVFYNGIGYDYALLILGIAAADTSVGLGLCILYFKASGAVGIN